MSGTILAPAAAAAILFTAGIRWGWFALGGGLMGVIMALIVFGGRATTATASRPG